MFASRSLALALVAGILAPAPLCAQAAGDSASSWAFSLDGGAGAPAGWVQVRENELAGTRLLFRNDLRVRRAWTVRGSATRRLGARTVLDVALEGWSLQGTAVPRSDVMFNGATLAADSVLHTRTGFGDFLQLTAQVRRRLAARARNVLSGSLGLTFVALNFVLQGTLAPGSALHETREDFVTQELPVPVAGLAYEHAFTPRLVLAASAAGGWLPVVNSLRREGGEVTLTQTHADLAIALRWRVSPRTRVSFGWRWTHFAQREESTEDGNAIRLDRGAVTVGASVF
jgi:hypothetical protein